MGNEGNDVCLSSRRADETANDDIDVGEFGTDIFIYWCRFNAYNYTKPFKNISLLADIFL